MTAAFVQTLGSAVKGASSLTVARTITVNTTVGNTVVVSYFTAASAAAQTLACADTKGNTYTLQTSQTSAAGQYTAIFSATITTQLVSGDTITVTQGGTGTANGGLACHEWSGLGTPIAVNGNTASAGATTATSNAATLAGPGAWITVMHTSTGSSTTTTGSLSSPWNARETGQTGAATVHWFGVWDQTAVGSTITAAPTLSQTAVPVAYTMSIAAFTGTAGSTATGAVAVTGSATPTVPVAAAGSIAISGSAVPPTTVGFVQSLGSAVKGSSSLTTVLTLTANTTVGNRVIVSYGTVESALGQTFTATDSKSNTWTQHQSQVQSAALVAVSFSAPITTRLVVGDTITVTQSGTATANGFLAAHEWAGLNVPITAAGAGSSTNVSSASSGNLTVATGAAYVGILHTNNGSSPASTGSLTTPWNARETGTTGAGSLHWYGVWDQVQSAGATVALAPTLSSSTSYVALLTAFTTASNSTAVGAVTISGSALGSGTSAGTVIHSWVGAPTSTGFRVRARTSGATSMRLAISTSAAMTSPTYIVAQTPDGNGYVDYTPTGLAPYTQYYYQLTDNPGTGEVAVGSVGKAKTLPAAGVANFKFGFGGCTNGYNVNREAVDDIRSWGADFFLHLGDFHYKSLTSTTTAVHRQGWEDQINFAPGLRELVREVPMWYCRSDHEAGPDNGDSNNAYTASSIAGYQQLVPYGTLGDAQVPPHGLYQTWVVGRVRFIMIDIRNIDRSPGSNTDDASKTMLGATQKTWLKAQLLQPEPVKVIVSDVAWMGPADIVAKPDAWWSYATERTEIANFIAANNVQVVLLHSDTHSIACASPTKNTYGGFPVYCSAPLANQGGGRDLTTFDSYYYGIPTTTDSRQYGRVTVTDTGSQITFQFSGWDAVTGTQQVGRSDTFTTPAASGFVTVTGSSASTAQTTAANAVTVSGSSFAIPVSSAATPQQGTLAVSGSGTGTLPPTVTTVTTTFTPPIRFYDPPIAADTPEIDMVPARYFKGADLTGKGVNIWVTAAGVSEQAPHSWDDVITLYLGGHIYDLTPAEVTLLTNAGYGANITTVTTTTGGGVIVPVGGGYGLEAYGVDPYGA